MRKQFSPEFAASVMAESDISSLPAVAHGIAKEPVARRKYLAAQADLSNEGCVVQDCGLVLHPMYRFLGASPDGEVIDPSVADMHGLLEIKCPASAFNNDLTPAEACGDPSFFCILRDNTVTLKRSHASYTQIQGQLAVTGLQWCDFFVWTGPQRMCERIEFDKDFWAACLPTLLSFCKAYLK